MSRGLAERDPGQAVLGKAAIGAIASSGIAWLLTEPRPAVASSLALLLVRASGYGLSLRFYLLAQRAFGRHGRAHVSDAHHRHPH